MKTRVIALVLCVLTLLLCFTSCAKSEDDKGAYIRMYLSEPIYDFDPLLAFDNADTLDIVSLLFSGLFRADEHGNPQKDLVDEYEYKYDEYEDRYYLTMTLNETKWSDGVNVNATHVQFAFRRLFYSDVSHPATALLYEVKNARAIVSGDLSVDHLGVVAKSDTEVEIEFEEDIDIDRFLRVLCSPALFPLRDDIVDFNADWAKKTSSLICSGPFMVRLMDYDEKDGFILERNSYYYRDREKGDAYDKYVTPFRLVCDFTTDIATQLANFNTGDVGSLYYLGNIPLAGRNAEAFTNLLKKGDLTDDASTHVYYLNEKAMIGDKALFADKSVRQALSLALDREAIAQALVFATAADGLVPNGIVNRADRNASFRKKAEQAIATSANVDAAKQLLSTAGINASSYSFAITVSALDSDHIATAELAKAAWEALGFKVSINKLDVTEMRDADGELTGMYANPYKEAVEFMQYTTSVRDADTKETVTTVHTVEVLALDLVATSADAFGYLAPFATPFSGNAMVVDTTVNPDYKLTPHVTGYQNADYDAKIEEAFAQKKESKRAKLLHEAEAMLLEDMPVIPVVYNQNFSLASGKLGKIESDFFCTANFTETKLSGYWKIALAEGFMNEDEDDGAGMDAIA
jgi:ABC-type oligopeptide transport system substrate-binding subunit